MLKLVVVAALIAVTSALPKVHPILGIVTPVDRCGGTGVPLQLRVTDCVGAPPCRVIVNRDYVIEGDFIPSQNSANAHFKLTAHLNDNVVPIVDGSIGALSGGQAYTASQTIRASSQFIGQQPKLRLEIYDVASARIEICIEALITVSSS